MHIIYMKRQQAHTSPEWGIQACGAYLELIRVTVSMQGKKHTWEWVSTGREIGEKTRQRLLKRFPLCEFPNDAELMWRSAKNRQARGQQ